MDRFAEWLSSYKIPIGSAGERFFTLVTDNFSGFFDGISASLGFLIDGLVSILLWIPSPVIILTAAVVLYLTKRSWKLSAGVAAGLLMIANQGFWVETMQTLALVVFATASSMLIGVPIGIFLGHRKRLYQLVLPVLDLMQTLPTFVYLIPTLVLFGLGTAPGLVATIVFTVPTVIRMSYLGFSSVPQQILEAGLAFGASPSLLLWKIEMPSALPVIMEGLTQCIMLALSMVVVAALVGADGLGKPVVRALSAVNIPLGLEAGLSIVMLAIILDRALKVVRK